MRLPSIKSVADDLMGYVPDEDRCIELVVVIPLNEPGTVKRVARLERLLKVKNTNYQVVGEGIDVLFHIGFGEVKRVEKALEENCPSWVESYNIDEDQREAAEECYGLDIRLQVMDDGDWSLHSGDSQFDDDHRGHWGCATLVPGMNNTAVREVARELIADLS
jgi:hypothetical protein